jgi:hypothetical protein
VVGAPQHGDERRRLAEDLVEAPLPVLGHRAHGLGLGEQPRPLGLRPLLRRDVAVEHGQAAVLGRVRLDGVPHIGARVVVLEARGHARGEHRAVRPLDGAPDGLGPLPPVVAPEQRFARDPVEPARGPVGVRDAPRGVEREERLGHPLHDGREPARGLAALGRVPAAAVAPRRHPGAVGVRPARLAGRPRPDQRGVRRRGRVHTGRVHAGLVYAGRAEVGRRVGGRRI